MNGIQTLTVRSNLVNYDLKLNRRVTIIRGDSGTGKTTLIGTLERARRGERSGIKVTSKSPWLVVTGMYWERAISDHPGYILFIDEDEEFLETSKFAGVVKRSDNYFVIITRLELKMLPYGISSIYEIKYSGKYTKIEQSSAYNIVSGMYWNESAFFSPSIVVTEDSGSGCIFFRDICTGSEKKIYSSRGNSNIVPLIRSLKLSNERILVCVDGAAYGHFINELWDTISADIKNVYFILAYESFEELILKSEMFMQHSDLRDRIIHPENHITLKQFSLENYFYDLLRDLTKNTLAKYRKDRLNKCYQKDCCIKKSTCEFCSYGNKRDIILGEYKDQLIFD